MELNQKTNEMNGSLSPQEFNKEAEKQVANSSEKNRNYLAVFLTVLIYLNVVIVQTTWLDLLLNYDGRGIKLPLIDVEMQLFNFYLGVPFLVLALHFNLLQNLESHYVKLHVWRYSFGASEQTQIVPRWRIYPFIFDYATLEVGGVLSGATRLASQLLVYWSGPFTLFSLLWRFTDYQSLGMSTFHFVCFLCNLWLVMRCRQFIDGGLTATAIQKTKTSSMSKPQNLKFWLRGFLFKAIRAVYWLFITGPLLFIRILSGRFWWVRGTQSQWFSNLVGLSIHWMALVNVCILVLLLQGTVQVKHLQPQWNGQILAPDLFVPRVGAGSRNHTMAFDEKALKTQYDLFEVLEGNKPSFHAWFMENQMGLLLMDRNFQYASFWGSDFRKAQFQRADLQYADVSNAQLQGADFYQAKLSFASFNRARMQGTDLNQAQLQGANLSYAQLQGADLSYADLRGANLEHAQLQGADLYGAQLQGANFWGANLEGANIGNSFNDSWAFIGNTQGRGIQTSENKLPQNVIRISTNQQVWVVNGDAESVEARLKTFQSSAHNMVVKDRMRNAVSRVNHKNTPLGASNPELPTDLVLLNSIKVSLCKTQNAHAREQARRALLKAYEVHEKSSTALGQLAISVTQQLKEPAIKKAC